MRNERMKAVVATQYGPPEVLELREVARPKPRPNEVLTKVLATTVSSGDCRIRSFTVPIGLWIPARLALGLTKPRHPIQGLWFSGEIEEVGKDVKTFSVGDEIYGRTPDMRLGAYAEFVCVPERGVIGKKPRSLTHAEAVSIPFGSIPRYTS